MIILGGHCDVDLIAGVINLSANEVKMLAKTYMWRFSFVIFYSY